MAPKRASAQFLSISTPMRRERKLSEHETSVKFLSISQIRPAWSASYTILRKVRVVYICLSTCPAPCPSAHLPPWHSFRNRGRERRLQVGGFSLPIEESARIPQTYQMPNPGEGVIFSVDQHFALAFIKRGSIVEIQWVVSATCRSVSYLVSCVYTCISSYSLPSIPSLPSFGWHCNEYYYEI